MTDLGAFLGARLGAHAALHAGTRLVRPLIVVVSCAMALRLMAAPGGCLPPHGKWRQAVDASKGKSL